MRFRLQEKFGKNIPTTLKNYIAKNTGLINFITNELHIDLSNASCGISKDAVKIHSAINTIHEDKQQGKNIGIIIFVILTSGEIIPFPYEYRVGDEHIEDFCLFHPERISKAYALYNATDEATDAFVDKLRFRAAVNKDRVDQYLSGQLRNGDYPLSVDKYANPISSLEDKSGYLVNPDAINKKLAKYRAENYSKYLSKVYKDINRYAKIIRDAANDIDAIDPRASGNISTFYSILSQAAESYNNLVKEIETKERQIPDPNYFKPAMQSLFNNGETVKDLNKALKTLKTLTSHFEYVDFNW